MDKIEASDSFQALLWGTMAAVLCTMIFYLVQFVQEGRLVLPNLQVLKGIFRGSDDENSTRVLMNVGDATESFLFGMGRIFPAIIVLNLAWAVGSMMGDVGADRLFARWLTDDAIDPESLPTLTFIISLFMALATGTSWGTMSILFPMILLPTWIASKGDAIIFYATTAGILSGSVAGDHISPISDTTVLSALACDCDLVAHVGTQMGYSIAVSVVSILLGTVPIGYDAWPNIVGILIGAVLIVGFVYGLCAPVLSATGRFDLLTELAFKLKGGLNEDLVMLKEDTVKAFNGQVVVDPEAENGDMEAKEKMLEESEDSHEEEEVVDKSHAQSETEALEETA